MLETAAKQKIIELTIELREIKAEKKASNKDFNKQIKAIQEDIEDLLDGKPEQDKIL